MGPFEEGVAAYRDGVLPDANPYDSDMDKPSGSLWSLNWYRWREGWKCEERSDNLAPKENIGDPAPTPVSLRFLGRSVYEPVADGTFRFHVGTDAIDVNIQGNSLHIHARINRKLHIIPAAANSIHIEVSHDNNL